MLPHFFLPKMENLPKQMHLMYLRTWERMVFRHEFKLRKNNEL